MRRALTETERGADMMFVCFELEIKVSDDSDDVWLGKVVSGDMKLFC